MTNNLTQQPEWQALVAHFEQIKTAHMRELFSAQADRPDQLSAKTNGILFDYSRNRITNETLRLLISLAERQSLTDKIQAMFAGDSVNTTEIRPALHPYLRDPTDHALTINGVNIAKLVLHAQQKMFDFAEAVQAGNWVGVTGKPIKHIINVGIGGSQIGPMLGVKALKDFAVSHLDFHFLGSIDPAHTLDVLSKLNPEESLFIISSKSFSTVETIANAKTVFGWLKNKLGQNAIENHVVAVTANTEKALSFDIKKDNIFPIWEWVGGRYSVWSAIGLPILLLIGKDHFLDFLAGAHEIDIHFRETPLAKNIPVLLALIGIWNTNFLHIAAQAVIPYSHRLRHIVDYLQQAEMESNGKSTTTTGDSINYQTAPVIFGQEGCAGQHSYHQLLHQGRQLIAADIIVTAKPDKHEDQSQHDLLLASALSQAHALMYGMTSEEVKPQLSHTDQDYAQFMSKHHAIAGNKPSNIIILNELSPKNLGALLAIYEHKIFVQSAIWDINPFDQWGVELGKKTLPGILQQLQEPDSATSLDEATTGLIKYFKQLKGME